MNGCDFCGGEGKVRLISIAGYEDVRTCPVCHGDGFIEAVRFTTPTPDASLESAREWIEELQGDLTAAQERIKALEAAEIRNFRWAYSLMIALAQKLLKEANEKAEDGAWPNGQEWHELVGTSHSIFFHQARDLAGVPHDEFLENVRNGKYPVDDLCERAANAL
jgi:hypothetical protein